MAEPLKNLLHPALVRQTAAHLSSVHPSFDADRFVALAATGLDRLELKARAMQICGAFEATLPADFDTAASVLEAALAPADTGDSPAAAASAGPGLAGWILWPAGEFIARRGPGHTRRALAALHAFTQRFTAEFAIRPFIQSQPDLVFDTLQTWASDPSAHVRRLVSEGSRPRLPWGMRLTSLVADPSPTLPLLTRLQDDPSAYVRRSVANHLNDIAKDHPAVVADWLETHLPGAARERVALLRHASRTLVKQGDARVLQAWGLGRPLQGQVSLSLSHGCVTLGDSVTLAISLQSTARQAQSLAVDYVVHHVKADGRTSPKVFKGWTLELPPGGKLDLLRRHSLRPVTTRRYHAGQHRIEMQVNGQPVAHATFDFQMPE